MKKKSQPQTAWKSWAPAVLIIVAVVVAFWPALSAMFIWDDDSVLTQNPLMNRPLHLIWFSTQPVDYFPVTYTSLWLEWRLWGTNAFGYHVMNIVMHAASCVIFWRIFERLKFPAPWLAALLFAVHPVNVESVAWIAERKNVLAMLFFALTALWFVIFAQTGSKRYYVLSIVAFLLSLFSKPAAVAWPLIALAILWFVQRANTKKRELKSNIILVLPFAALSLVLSVVAMWFQATRAVGNDVIHQHHDLLTRVLVAAGAIWFYLLKALVPVTLMFAYPNWTIDSRSVLAYAPIFALVVIAALLWLFWKTWGKPLLIGFGYFVLMLAPVVGLVDVYFQRYSYVSDHWQYFALPAVMVLVAVALVKLKVHRVIGPALVVLFAFAAFTHARIFHDSESLWADTLQKNPNSWLALNNLGYVREMQHRPDDAVALYNRSLEVHPEQPEAHNNLGKIFSDAGRLDDAEHHLRAAIQYQRDYCAAYFNLAGVYRQRGDLVEAVTLYHEALRHKPDYSAAYNNLGCVLAFQGQTDKGIANVRKAIEIEPNYADALGNLGSLLNDQGKPREAIGYLNKALALDPRSSDHHLNLGNSLYALGDIQNAQGHFINALQLQPSQLQARYGLANCLLRSGHVDDAEKLFLQVLEANPKHAESHYQMATILAAKGAKARAIEELRETVRLKPNWPIALNNLAWALVTDEKCKATDSAQAIRLASHAVELTAYGDATSLDTLAAAWARSEVFSKATETEQLALTVAIRANATNLVPAMEKRLALYKTQTTYSEK